MRTVPEWDKYFHDIARVIASRSKDPSTQVGAVVFDESKRILTVGYNGFPSGVKETPLRWGKRPEKYMLVEHAERNAIYSAARNGISLQGASICIWASQPIGVCADCARAIIQSGITTVYGYVPDVDRPNLGESLAYGHLLLAEARVHEVYCNDPFDEGAPEFEILDVLEARSVGQYDTLEERARD